MIQFQELQNEEDNDNSINQKSRRKYILLLSSFLIFGLSIFGVAVVYVLSTPSDLPNLQDKPPKPTVHYETSCTSSLCIETAKSLVDSMNSSVDPCEDFFEFACGGWIARNPLPSDEPTWSPFEKLDAKSNKITQGILSQPVKSSDPKALKQAKEFYSTCVNVDGLDRLGLNPILSLLDDYGGWPMITGDSWSPKYFDWIKSMAHLKRVYGTSALFDIQIDQQDTSPHNLTTINLSQPSLYLARPYLLDYKRYSRLIAAYKEFIIGLANELAKAKGISLSQRQLSTSAQELISFESTLAGLTKDKATVQFGLRHETGDSLLPDLQAELDSLWKPNAPNKLDLKKLLVYSLGSNQIETSEHIVVSLADMSFTEEVVGLIATTSPKTLSNYLNFRMLAATVGVSTKKMQQIIHKYRKEVFGVEASNTESDCASSAEQKFGLALSRPYLERNKITGRQFDQVDKMIEEIRTSFVSLLDEVNWMNSTVKRDLREKAASSIKSCVGFAEWMLPNSTSNLYEQKLEESLTENDLGHGRTFTRRIRRLPVWQRKRRMINAETKSPSSESPDCEWTTYLGETNAFYDPNRQTINFPLGILQLPFLYTDDTFSSVNYGALGSTIGHEFTHGFSVNGWTENDDDGSFTRVSQCLVDQYNGYGVKEVPGGTVNGALTLDENFADNGGLTAAYRAYQSSSPNEHNVIPGLERFTQDQLFFLGYASTRCVSSRPEALRDSIFDDEHTPFPIRVLGTLQNSKEFAEAWNCPVGSNMNPRGITRCTVF